jgi:site-specific DNA recombinase
LRERQAAKDEDHTARPGALKAKLADAENRLGRLYAAIESGVADLTDLTLKDRVAAVKTERDIAQTAYDRALAETSPRARITPDRIAASVEVIRHNILTGDTPFRRAYIRSVIDQVEVDDAEIRIIGRRTVLERLVIGRRVDARRSAQFCSEVARPRDSNRLPFLPSVATDGRLLGVCRVAELAQIDRETETAEGSLALAAGVKELLLF